MVTAHSLTKLKILIGCGLYLALATIVINTVVFKYPGNIYLWSSLISVFLILWLITLGLNIAVEEPEDSNLFNTVRGLFYFYAIALTIQILCTGVQYTPFSPIDNYLLAFDNNLHINLSAIIAWTENHPFIKAVADNLYNSLALQILIIPILLAVLRQYQQLHKLSTLILISGIIGFGIYYFFPTTAPASVINSPYFEEAQRHTGMKFWQIHNYITPTYSDGGMIALPSFHVIWGLLLALVLRPFPIAFTLLLTTNILLSISCVLLGWHYAVDVLSSVIVLFVSYKIYDYLHPNVALIVQSEHDGKVWAR